MEHSKDYNIQQIIDKYSGSILTKERCKEFQLELDSMSIEKYNCFFEVKNNEKEKTFEITECPRLKYLEIIHTETNEVILRLNVTLQSDRSIERVERGMNINLNHNEYHTFINISNVRLDEIDSR